MVDSGSYKTKKQRLCVVGENSRERKRDTGAGCRELISGDCGVRHQPACMAPPSDL